MYPPPQKTTAAPPYVYVPLVCRLPRASSAKISSCGAKTDWSLRKGLKLPQSKSKLEANIVVEEKKKDDKVSEG